MFERLYLRHFFKLSMFKILTFNERGLFLKLGPFNKDVPQTIEYIIARHKNKPDSPFLLEEYLTVNFNIPSDYE